MNAFGNSYTQVLLHLVGSPFVKESSRTEVKNEVSMYEYAARNRIRLLFLDSLLRDRKSSHLGQEQIRLIERYERTLVAFSKASRALDDAGIEYAFFKSSRPYREATVDLDILVFGNHHKRAVNALREKEYLLLEEGVLSTTMHDKSVPVSLDLYDEVGMNRIIYLDKDRLQMFMTTQELGGGTNIRTLSIEADLLAIIAHSVVKEHMYVLSEYFTTLGYLNRMGGAQLTSLIDLTKDCNLEHAVSTHLNLTAYLHHEIHGFVPDVLQELLGEIKPSMKEIAKSVHRNHLMPHRYSPSSVMRALFEKLDEPKARRSMLSQLASVIDPRCNHKLFRTAYRHLRRESY